MQIILLVSTLNQFFQSLENFINVVIFQLFN